MELYASQLRTGTRRASKGKRNRCGGVNIAMRATLPSQITDTLIANRPSWLALPSVVQNQSTSRIKFKNHPSSLSHDVHRRHHHVASVA